MVAELAAGAVFDGAIAPGQALRIMTGAPMPAGAGTVYPQEIVERSGGRVRIGAGPPASTCVTAARTCGPARWC